MAALPPVTASAANVVKPLALVITLFGPAMELSPAVAGPVGHVVALLSPHA